MEGEDRQWHEAISKDEWRDWLTSQAAELFFDNLAGILEERKVAVYKQTVSSTDKDEMWRVVCEGRGFTRALAGVLNEAKELGGLADADSA